MFDLIYFAKGTFSNYSFNLEVFKLGAVHLFLLKNELTWFTLSAKVSIEAGVFILLAEVISFDLYLLFLLFNLYWFLYFINVFALKTYRIGDV